MTQVPGKPDIHVFNYCQLFSARGVLNASNWTHAFEPQITSVNEQIKKVKTYAGKFKKYFGIRSPVSRLIC